jgi:hypothetical protein
MLGLHWLLTNQPPKPGGRHGKRPDAEQQGKEEAEAGQERQKGRQEVKI